MFMSFRSLLSSLFLLIPFLGFAQWGKGISVEPTLHIGKIYKHTPKLLFPVENISTGFELNFTNKKFGKKSWHQQLAAQNLTFEK